MRRSALFIIPCLLFSLGVARADLRNELSKYVYEDTRQMVHLVEDAAGMMEKAGTDAFSEFEKPGSRWRNDTFYLFVYSINGECVFHPIESALVGRNLIDFKDIDGRPVIRMITEIGRGPADDASGWVFYKWEDPWLSSFPQWKSSYIRKVVTPDGKVYLLGCGLYNMKIEKVFVQQQVDKAAALIVAQGGAAAFRWLKYPYNYFDIMDSHILVIDASGKVEVSPNFPTINIHRNLMNMTDKSGKDIGREVREALQKRDSTWISFLWPKGDARHLARELAYIRKVTVGDRTYFVLMDFFPALPIWMK